MKKFLFVILAVVSIFLISFVVLIYVLPSPHKSSRPVWHTQSEKGYAPFKFSAHNSWVPDKRYDYIVLRRKLSPTLPESVFNLQVQEISQVTGIKSMIVDEYTDNYFIKELKEIHKAEVLSNRPFVVDAFAARDVVYRYSLTIRGLTREVKSRTIIFIAGEYAYSLDLGSFEKDFDQANIEFERMVSSFHFLNEEAVKVSASKKE